MPFDANRSVTWSPTIALSWLWGLGFFYAIHVTLEYGWLGFLSFAAPNATGLFLFGWILGSPKRNPTAILRAVESRYAGLFLLCQLCAVAITIFGVAAYLWTPMALPHTAIGVGVLVLGACVVGHIASVNALRILHAFYFVVGVVAALVAWRELQGTTSASVPFAALDGRFYGLLSLSLVGFLLGPWTDIQHWQRVVEIQRNGGSIRLAYGVGALLFLALISINALLASSVGRADVLVAADGVPGAQASVAFAAAHIGRPVAAIAFFIWAANAAASTIDSSYCATRWLMNSITTRSVSALLALIPAGLVASPLWIMLVASGMAIAMVWANLSQLYLMAPFATLFVGAAASLICESLGVTRRYDAVLCYLIGLAASLTLLAGYLVPISAFMAIAPFIALLGAIPMATEVFTRRGSTIVTAEAALSSQRTEPVVASITVANRDAAASYGFDGRTFVIHLVPTYDDTNSVGNIYFANYMRWVGKAREMFFDACMPSFDLKTTNYYVLTRSFTHQFRREAREFDPVTVRIWIASHNRKFVTLEHEIHGDKLGLLGRGEQSLMFVDTEHFRPLDIPRAIIEGFLPYWPKGSPHAPGEDLQDALATHELRSIEP
jgi:acyl-CoA thioesterase FadM